MTTETKEVLHATSGLHMVEQTDIDTVVEPKKPAPIIDAATWAWGNAFAAKHCNAGPTD